MMSSMKTKMYVNIKNRVYNFHKAHVTRRNVRLFLKLTSWISPHLNKKADVND